MLKGKVLSHFIQVIELSGVEKMSYTCNFTIKLASEVGITPSIGEKIEVEGWTGRIILWRFLYVGVGGKHYYQCEFCSDFEFFNSGQKFAIRTNLNAKEIITNMLQDFDWNCPEGKKLPYLVQYEESDLRIISYLAHINGFSYFALGGKVIFADKPHLFGKVIKLRFSIEERGDLFLVSTWGFEVRRRDTLSRIYGYNAARPSDFIYAEGEGVSQCYLLDLTDPVDAKARIVRNNHEERVYYTETINPNIRVGDRVIFSNHDLAGNYYVIKVEHRYKEHYRNRCVLLMEGDLHLETRAELNLPRGVQVGEAIFSRGAEVMLKFPWSKTPLSIPAVMSTAGKGYGSLIMPREGERVVVGFSSPCQVYMLGSIYDAACSPPIDTNASTTHAPGSTYVLRASAKTQAIMEEKRFTMETLEAVVSGENLTIKNPQVSIELTKDGCNIRVGAAQVKISDSSLIFAADNIALKGATLQIEADTVDLRAKTFDLRVGEVNFHCEHIFLSAAEKMLFNTANLTMKAMQGATISAARVDFFTNTGGM